MSLLMARTVSLMPFIILRIFYDNIVILVRTLEAVVLNLPTAGTL